MELSLRKKVVFSLIVLLTPMALLEVGLRIFTSQNSQWNVRIGGNKQFDPVTGVRNKPNIRWTDRVLTNEHGYLAPQGITYEKPPDTVRMIFMGDSVTFFPIEHNYPREIEERWEDRYSIEIEVLNAAVAGFASDNVRALYESEIRDYEADYFFLYVGWNDLGQYGPEGLPYKRIATGYEVSNLERIVSNIYTVRIFYALQRYMRHKQPTVDAPLNPADEAIYDAYYPSHFDENLRAVLTDARQRYPHVYVANLATITNSDPTPWELETAHFPTGMDKNIRKLDRLVATYNEVVEKVAREEGIPMVDLHGAFDDRSARRFFRDSCHVTVEGTRRLAASVLGVMEPPIPE